MSFFQPWMLFGLPLVLLPWWIHLWNRRRHPQHSWATTRFLREALDEKRGRRNLRHWCVLLCRILVILCLIMAASLPFSGGWLGQWMGDQSREVVVLFDRSLSMEGLTAEGERTKREEALHLIVEAADSLGIRDLVVIDNVNLKPTRIAVNRLAEFEGVQASDTGASIPQMIRVAQEYVNEQASGSKEIWLATDHQASSWEVDSPLWKDLRRVARSSVPPLRVRLLSQSNHEALDRHIRARGEARMENGEIIVDFTVHQSGESQGGYAVTMKLGDISVVRDFPGGRGEQTFQERFPLTFNEEDGWGSVALPPDANLRNNISYFGWSRGGKELGTLVVTSDTLMGKRLQIGLEPRLEGGLSGVHQLLPEQFQNHDLADYGAIYWQGRFPSAEESARLLSFARERGIVVLFPSGKEGDLFRMGALEFSGEIEEVETPLRVSNWRRDDGPLANQIDGDELPVGRLSVRRWQSIQGNGEAVAILSTLSNDEPWLVRTREGLGVVYGVATLPEESWSNLSEGWVWVPMLQRLRGEATRSTQGLHVVTAGRGTPLEGFDWEVLSERDRGGEPATSAGVYVDATQGKLLVVERSVEEDRMEMLDPGAIREVMGPDLLLSTSEFLNSDQGAPGNLWGPLLLGVLLFLVMEGLCSLPPSRSRNRIQPVIVHD